jgi:hypothetical protein
MSDTDNELDQAVDPPNNDGGTGKTAVSMDSSTADAEAVDPPNNDGGTGK